VHLSVTGNAIIAETSDSMKKIRRDLSSLEAYPLQRAEECIRRYVERVVDHSNMTSDDVVRAYSVKQADALAALGVTGDYTTPYDYFRAYIGIAEVSLDGKVVDQYKLFLVPIADDETDVILEDEDGNRYVYDFNTPCPNTCDFGSPLYKAGNVDKK
jgi:hypothetical protein